MHQISVARLFADNHADLELAWVAGGEGGERLIHAETASGTAVIGYFNPMHPNRVQVLGHAESAYFDNLAPNLAAEQLRALFAAHPPALIVADGAKVPSALANSAAAEATPLLCSPMPAPQVLDVLRDYLARTLAESTSVHGVMMDVLGLGVLITGDSGVGKSELGLELISRGHGLVADDIVEVSRVGPKSLIARCPPMLKNFLEVRGLGVLNIRTIFGETAVRTKIKLHLIVHLHRPHAVGHDERLPLNAQVHEMLGVTVRKVVIPVAAGRNLAVLLEAAVRNYILQLRGIDSTAEFIELQKREIDKG